ncbi:hypothetical protein HK096_006243 [Nowakowskiella sp. JEL0078]|nr:hypothetical protein HK096_006243 [Nowakowskiella sp. JEL0078]
MTSRKHFANTGNLDLSYSTLCHFLAHHTDFELLSALTTPIQYPGNLLLCYTPTLKFQVGVVGLNNLTYNDKTLGGQKVEETNERIIIQSEVDRAYLQVKSEILIDEKVEYAGDQSSGRIGLFKIRKSSSMTDVGKFYFIFFFWISLHYLIFG